jgi:Na+/H+ antiporter NhaA
MGIAFLLTSAFSVGAIIQRNHVTIGLVILNWVLLADAIIVLVVGTVVWFYTLRERSEFHTLYAKMQPSQRITIQDKVNYCCNVSLSAPF